MYSFSDFHFIGNKPLEKVDLPHSFQRPRFIYAQETRCVLLGRVPTHPPTQIISTLNNEPFKSRSVIQSNRLKNSSRPWYRHDYDPYCHPSTKCQLSITTDPFKSRQLDRRVLYFRSEPECTVFALGSPISPSNSL